MSALPPEPGPYRASPYESTPHEQTPHEPTPYEPTPYAPTPYEPSPHEQSPHEQSLYEPRPHEQSPYGPIGQSPSLQGYGRFVRRNRALLALLTVTGAVVGAALVVRTPPEYEARASVAVTPQPTGADIDPNRPSLVSLDSDAQILSSGDVLARAAIATGFPGGPDALSANLDVSARPNSRVLIVRVTSDDHDMAVAACSAVVEEFLTTRAATETERAATSAADLDAEISSLLERLGAFDTASDPDDPASSSLAAELAKAELQERLAELEDQLRLVTTAGIASPGTITRAATAPAGGARPMAAATLASGVLLGAMGGVGVASVREAGLAGTARGPAAGTGSGRRRMGRPAHRPRVGASRTRRFERRRQTAADS